MSAIKWAGEKILVSCLQELGRRTGEALAELVKRKLQPPKKESPT